MAMTGVTDDPQVVVVDYGGVLTNPIADTIGHFAAQLECEPRDLLSAMVRAADGGEPPMAQLERAEITEAEFMARIGGALTAVTGRPTDLVTFREAWFAGRCANVEMLAYLGDLRRRGRRLALLTNNVREWEPRWRRVVPADQLFDVVVISANEGCRKPEPRIYEITTSRLGVAPHRCLLVDDDHENCLAAQRHGMDAHHFTATGAAIAAVERWLAGAVEQPPQEEVTACR